MSNTSGADLILNALLCKEVCIVFDWDVLHTFLVSGACNSGIVAYARVC